MTETHAEKLLERNRVGALIRIFAATPEEVAMQIDSAMIALRKLLALKTGARKTFARVDFLVSSDPDFDDSDCGETAPKLRELVHTEFPDAPINVYEIKKGDIYTMLLNYGIAIQLEDRVPYSLILSHREHEHIVEENIHALFAAMHNKARVAGLVLPEIEDTIGKGRIANTFAIWHNKSLLTVGGFDLRAGKPLKQEVDQTNTITGFSDRYAERYGDGSIQYLAAGCEEIIPLLRMKKYFGPCIALVNPVDTSVTPAYDEILTEDWNKRHYAKLATKDGRQRYMADLTGLDIGTLAEGLL